MNNKIKKRVVEKLDNVFEDLMGEFDSVGTLELIDLMGESMSGYIKLLQDK